MVWEIHKKTRTRTGAYSKIRDMLGFVAVKKGDLSLTRGSWMILGQPRYVQFVTDGTGRAGFKACKEGDDGAFKVQDRNRGNVLRVGCKSASTKYGLSDEIGTRFYTLRKEGDVLVFQLSQRWERI